MSHHTITQLIDAHGLTVVFAAAGLQALGAPVPGTTVLITAAIYAAAGHGLPIAGVIAAGALGAICGTSIGYVIGRLRGGEILRWVARRIRRDPDGVDALRAVVARRGAVWLIAARFISGMRNVAGLLAGASGMSWWRFAAFSAAGALAWATFSALEYYFFGRALAAADTWVQVVLVACGIAWLVFSLRIVRRRALAELQDLRRAQ